MPRITIRLSDTLYDRLLLYARGRNRGSPEVAPIVREALETYLTQHKRQTSCTHSGRQSVPHKRGRS